MKVKIKSMDGYFNTSNQSEFEKFGLVIGDIVEVRKLTSNAYIYQPIPKGDTLIMYSHQIETIV